jgi:hypothetical protein
MTSPHISWLKHGLHTQTALVGSVVVGRVALEGDLWAWHASLPMATFWRTTAVAKQSDRRKNIWKVFLKLWIEPFRPLMSNLGVTR